MAGYPVVKYRKSTLASKSYLELDKKIGRK
jgi:hypothetical protein